MLETVGQATWAHSVRSLKPGGRIVISGATSGDAPPGHEREALSLYLLEGTPLVGSWAEFLATGEGRWRVDLMTARWAPSGGDFDRIDAIAERLERARRKMSAPDDEMTV